MNDMTNSKPAAYFKFVHKEKICLRDEKIYLFHWFALKYLLTQFLMMGFTPLNVNTMNILQTCNLVLIQLGKK